MAVDYAALEAAYKSGDPAKIKAANQAAQMMASSSGGMNDTMKMMEMNQLQQSQQMYQNQYKDAGAKFTADAKSAAEKSSQEAANAASKAAEAAMPGTRAIQTQVKYDAEGRPIRNDYMSITDKDGNLGSQYSLADKIGPDINLNTTAMDEMRNRAMSTGPSAWANLAMEKQGLEQTNAMDQANRSVAGQQTQAMNSMRSRGGMSNGQRERMAMQGARAGATAQQGVANQGLLNRSNILLQDQQSKDQMLTQLPGMDLAKGNFDQNQRSFNAQATQYDIGNKLKDVGGLNAYNSDGYGKAMQEWGSAKTADAQRAASSGGGGTTFICSALRRHGYLSTRESLRMTKFMLASLLTRADFFAWYFINGKKAVDQLEAEGFEFALLRNDFAVDILRTLRTGDLVKAQNDYISRTGALCRSVLGDDCGYKDSMARSGLLKSLVRLPRVFTIPCTWAWSFRYLKGKALRSIKSRAASAA